MSEEVKAAQADVTQAAFRLLNSVVAPAVKSGAANPLPIGAGAVVLETTGHKSGKTRSVPLLASRVCDKLMVTTVRGNSHWLKNVESDPEVAVWLFGVRRQAIGTVQRGPLNIVMLDLLETE